MKALHSRYTLMLFALVAGALLPLSLAPFHLPIFAFASLALLFYTIQLAEHHGYRAHWLGLLYGIGVYSLGIYWLFYAMHRYGQMNTWLAMITLMLFVLALSVLFFWPLGFLCAWVNQPSRPWTYRLLAFPATWTLFEIIKTKLFTGFPWLLLGYSQIGWPFSGIAPILGVYGVSWLVVLAVACLFECHHQTSPKIRGCLIMLVVFLFASCQVLRGTHWTHPKPSSIPIRLIQPNISIQDKWNPNMLPKILAIYTQQLQAIPSGITIFPEGMLPLIQEPQTQKWLHHIDQKAREAHATIIMGGMFEASNRTFYNAVLLLGMHHGLYRKHHLVPFGEFMPFSNTLHALYRQIVIPMANLSAGPINQRLPKLGEIILVPSICYEIAYPFEMAEKTHASGGNLIFSISEDGWFGPSIEPKQHLQIAQMRALENGKLTLIATNQGPSAIINSQGHIIQQSAHDTRMVLEGTIHASQGFTPWTRWGKECLGWLMALLLAIPYTLQRLSRHQTSRSP